MLWGADRVLALPVSTLASFLGYFLVQPRPGETSYPSVVLGHSWGRWRVGMRQGRGECVRRRAGGRRDCG